MARVHHVASSRTPHTCKAGHVIEPPEGYSWAAPGFRGAKRFACAAHPFRPSELTTSAVGDVLAAQEALEDDAPNWTSAGDAENALEDFKSALSDFRDQRQEALDQWEHGNSQIEDLLQDAESAVSEIESFSIPEWSGDVDESEAADSEDDDVAEEWDRYLDELRSGVTDAVSSAVDQL